MPIFGYDDYSSLWYKHRARWYSALTALLTLMPMITFAQKGFEITINESINPASAEFIIHSIQSAEEKQGDYLLIHLNTPGGLLSSTRDIVTAMIEAKIPIIVYVAPSGSRAGSAGTFITMAAHIAAMAPGTNIGAAHPVDLQGQTDEVMNEKSTNDAAAFMRSIARIRGRNIDWAEDAVRKSASITETEALKEKVIDLIAADEGDLFHRIDGRSVQTYSGVYTLHTAGTKPQPIEMNFFVKILSILSDPNIAYILLMIGFFGLVFEFTTPGAILPGVIGVISLILAFYSMSALPVNYASVALIVFGVILYLLEIKIASHGMLTTAATVSILLGSVFLLRTSPMDDIKGISGTLIITTTVTTLIFFLFIISMGLKAQRAKIVSGSSALIGRQAVVITDISGEGMVMVGGEKWRAVSDYGHIPADTEVVITGVSGLTVTVQVVPPPEETNLET